jgi:hypothetical protein
LAQLIVTGDDFGLSPAVNQAIVKAHVDAQPDLMAIPGPERAAAHQR